MAKKTPVKRAAKSVDNVPAPKAGAKAPAEKKGLSKEEKYAAILIIILFLAAVVFFLM